MTIPGAPNIRIKHTNDPKFAGMNGITSLFMEKIPAVSAIGEMNSCNVREIVRNPFLSARLASELTIISMDSPLLAWANSR